MALMALMHVFQRFPEQLEIPALLCEAGLCGGSYYRTAAVLDAFSDESSVGSVSWWR